MLTLLTFSAGFDSPSLSPFCTKAMYLLNTAGHPWKAEIMNDPRRMPHGKLPVLRTEDRLVPDSDGIRLHLERQGADFMAGLSAVERADTHLIARMAEENLRVLLALDRWERDEIWLRLRDIAFAEIPKLIRGPIANKVRKKVLAGLHAHSLGPMTWEERLQRADQDLTAIETRLGDKPFLFGDRPTLADMTLAPFLLGMRGAPVPTPLSKRVSDNPVLNAYTDRAHAAMMPS